jgi:hypothetical protein
VIIMNRRTLLLGLLGSVIAPHVISQDDTKAKADCERLLRAAVPAAEAMLRAHGEFAPFAVGMTAAGALEDSVQSDEAGQPSSQRSTGRLRDAISEGIKGGRFRAAAYVYEARVTAPPSSRQQEAIAIALEHRDGYSATVVIPYELKNGRVKFAAPQRIERRAPKPVAAPRR